MTKINTASVINYFLMLLYIARDANFRCDVVAKDDVMK